MSTASSASIIHALKWHDRMVWGQVPILEYFNPTCYASWPFHNLLHLDPYSKVSATLVILMLPCQPPHPSDALPSHQGPHLHHEVDIQGPCRHPRPLRLRADVVNPCSHLPITLVSQASEARGKGERAKGKEQRAKGKGHTRSYGMSRFPLPKPEHHP